MLCVCVVCVGGVCEIPYSRYKLFQDINFRGKTVRANLIFCSMHDAILNSWV